MLTTGHAEAVARDLLADPLPRRWAHTRGVAATARTLEPILGEHAELITTAAWLHDIGYAPDLDTTGFHPLDGARHLRDALGAGTLLCCLVAHHSGALAEATARGLAGDLTREFELPPTDLLDAITYSDVTTSPDGHRVTVQERVDDILARYGPGHLVTNVVTASAPALTATVARVEARLGT